MTKFISLILTFIPTLSYTNSLGQLPALNTVEFSAVFDMVVIGAVAIVALLSGLGS
jgi:hypothetical protein